MNTKYKVTANRLESSTRVLAALCVKRVAGARVVTGTRPSGPFTFHWPGRGKAPFLLFDFGQKVAGLLRIHSRRIDGPYVGVRYCYGPYADFCPFEFTAPFGDWQAEELSAFRFLKVTVPEEYPCPTRIAIESVDLVRTDCPLVRTGYFSCDDRQLNRIWTAGVDTVQLCVQPNSLAGYAAHYHPENRQWLQEWKSTHSAIPYTIWDGVRRDREAWLGDAYFGSFAWLYAGGDRAPVLNNFEIWSAFQREDGELIVSSFSRQRFTEYNLWFAPALDAYLELTGDVKAATKYFKTFQRCQDWIMGRLNRRNFLKVRNSDPRLHTWQYTIRRDGVVTYLQAVLYRNLLSASSLENAFGSAAKSKVYADRAESVKAAINRHLWNATGGYYGTSIEGENRFDAVAQDANAACLLYGIAAGDRAKRVRNFLKKKCWTPFGSATYDRRIPPDREGVFLNSNWSHNRNVWCYAVILEIEGLFRQGFGKDALELTKRCFGNMVARGPGTLWEMALADSGESPEAPFFLDTYNSFCHAWGSYVSYFLQAYVAGIRPLARGFSEVLIAPRPCGLRKIDAAVPTPRGIIRISCKIARNKAVVNITLPRRVRFRFDESGLAPAKVKLIVNGR